MAGRTALSIEFEFRNKRFTDANVGLAEYAKAMGTSVERATPALKRALKTYLDSVHEALSLDHGRPWPVGTSNNTLSRRSGGSLRAIKRSIRVTGKKLDRVQGVIGGPRRLLVHEFGGVIRVKRKKYLTIPTKHALDARGIPRRPKARDWPNTFVQTSKRGNLIIFQKRGKDIVPLYVLKKSVKIPPRLGMGRRLRSQLPFFVDRSFEAMLKAVRDG